MKDKIIVFMFISLISIFSISHIVIKDKEISETERRKLKSFPEFKLSSEYITEIDKYLLDHFPLRDTFRSIKAKFNYNVLNKLDNNGIYLKDNYIFKSNYPTNIKSIDNFISKINKLKENLTSENNVYFSLIPDKNYYLDEKDFLHIDYDYIYESVSDIATFIDLRNVLTIEDYYETDTHWRQEKIDKVVKKLNDTMKFNYKEYDYKLNKIDDFYGVYYGESAINRKGETLYYLTNEIIDSAKVIYLENKDLNKVYSNDINLDAYNIYLDGASSFIEIYNENSENNKELVIFRDSFGSSITPLLIPYYKKITLIDNRYITSDNYLKIIQFNNQDILFLYSTLLVNDSSSLKG